MSYPILYSSDETNFSTNGLGVLSDAISCEVVEERNGSFELTLQYPITGIHYEEINDRCLIKAKPNQVDNLQLFRVYAKSKPMSGIVVISAAHISYDLTGIPCIPFTASSAADAMNKLSTQTAVDNPFEFWTDKTTNATFVIDVPKSVRTCMGGGEGSILDVYGGEFLFDNYKVSLYNQRGMSRGVVIKYGKNLTDIKQDENCSNVYTGIYPYYVNPETGQLIDIDSTGTGNKILRYSDLPNPYKKEFGFDRIKPLDLSDEFETPPNGSTLKLNALQYLKSNDLSSPNVYLNVSFAQLEQSEEYKGLQLLESVYLCDTVTVEFPELGVNTTAKATKIVYDVLLERVKNVHLGSIMTTFIDTVTEQKQEIEKIQSPTYLQQAVNKATNWITSGGGYMVAVKDENGQWKELLSLDTADIESAKSVWRWNNNGFGYSSTGYNGPFTTAITQDGQIVADFITTGTLNANIIKSGILSSPDGTSYFNLESGYLHTSFGSIGGWNVGEDAIYKEVTESKNNGTYKYCAYIQSPYSVGDDTWVYSTQVYEPGSDGYRGTFYVTIKGDMHVQRIDSDKTIYTNCAEDDSIYGAIEHRRGGYYGAFGVSKDDDGTWYGASIQCRNSNRITSRLDVREGEADGLVILETYQEGTDNKKYRSYLSFGNGYLCAGEVKYGSVNLLDFQAKDGHFQTIKTAGTGFAAIEHTRGSYMGSLGVGTSADGENSVALQLRTSSAVLARLDVCDTAYSGCVTLQTTANSKYSYLTFFPDVIVAGKADNYDNTSAMLNFKANEIFSTKVYQSSTESIKTNITAADSVLGLFEPKNSQIYSYNLKKTVTTPVEGGGDGDVSVDGEGFEITEEVEETTSYGFVIGDGYAVPEQVLNKEGNAISLYSMAALTWKAVQELYLKIKALEETING